MVSEWIWRSLHFQMLNVKSDSLITNNFFRFFAGQIHTHNLTESEEYTTDNDNFLELSSDGWYFRLDHTLIMALSAVRSLTRFYMEIKIDANDTAEGRITKHKSYFRPFIPTN